MSVRVIHGDCLEAMRALAAEGVRSDACVTDPPYELSFMSKGWDGTGIAFRPETWRAVYDVLKPGAHLLAFGGTRTFHRMAVAIEDAGFELRDTMMWLYGTGFPKSHDVSKGIDKAFGAERTEGVPGPYAARKPNGSGGVNSCGMGDMRGTITAPATDAAKQWAGWGTALKPAWEPIIVARKPLEGTVAANVLAHGTGAINIDACRVPMSQSDAEKIANMGGFGKAEYKREAGVSYNLSVNPMPRQDSAPHTAGRWPANVLHDGSDEVEAAFAAFGEKKSGSLNAGHKQGAGSFGKVGGDTILRDYGGDTGTASRFFAKCEPGEDELLIWRAKAILAQCNQELASTADNVSFLPKQAVASALSGAVTSASRGAMRLHPPSFQAPSTGATPSELRRISEAAITAILSIENGLSPEQPHEKPIRNGCLVKCAEAIEPTATTTITISRWKSDGSAEPVTFSITQANSELGARGLAGASRFHYCAKASAKDRAGSKHPTVKPQALMRWLVRLVTPPGGTVLDPFAGSGSTLQAAMAEGFDAIGIEREAEYHADCLRRVAEAQAGSATASGAVEQAIPPLLRAMEAAP